MNYKLAIKLLAPYHVAQLIWVVPQDTDHPTDQPIGPIGPTGQLTTGHPDYPIISVDHGNVCADDLYTILDLLAADYAPISPVPVGHPHHKATTILSSYPGTIPFTTIPLLTN